jgi:glutamate-1-semialdehyde aminotransferase
MSLPFSSATSLDSAWRTRAAAVIPGGASTGSKRPDALFGEDAEDVPTHFASASGCRLVTAGGTELVDCIMALGAVGLGYADEAVTHAVVEAVSQGNVAGLSHTLEVEVAERLCEVIPCAERVRFLKSGAEGVAAAVRIARAHTGRSLVLGCGYFGWLDWYTGGPGITPGAHADFRGIPFDDSNALEDAVRESGDALAAIVIEPVIERLPSVEWIATARRLCDEVGAVLIFDEMKTGFRLRTGGYQELVGIAPDVAVFGKALANGFPLSAIVGRAGVMQAAHRTWISSTLAGESVALAAAGAVLDAHAHGGVCETIWETGAAILGAVEEAIGESGVPGVSVRGIPPMWLLEFDDESRRSRFLEIAVGRGVLFKRGAYNYASTAHDDEARALIGGAASDALHMLREEERGI